MTQTVTLTDVRAEQVTQLQAAIGTATALNKQATAAGADQRVLAVVRGDL